MTISAIIFFAIIEGLTEFLPISSTAHLLLAQKFWPVTDQVLFAHFSILIQLGAILAIATLFIPALWRHKKTWPKLIISITPTILIGFLVYPFFKKYLQADSSLTGWALITGGIFFSYLDYRWRHQENKLTDAQILTDESYLQEIEQTSWWRLALIGLAQAVAIVPGVSRSGATIFGARAVGFNKVDSTKLAFVLALPTIAGATLYDLYQASQNLTPIQIQAGLQIWPSLFLGLVCAYGIALLIARPAIKFLATKPFYYWGIYRCLVGIIWLFWF